LLDIVEKQFANTTDYKIMRRIAFDETRKTLSIYFGNNAKNENETLLFVREFSNILGSVDVEHLYLILPEKHRKLGLIKPVFQASLQEYINMNASSIKVVAGLSGGGYVWAKYGFVATEKSEVEIILNKAVTLLKSNEYKIIERIFNIY